MTVTMMRVGHVRMRMHHRLMAMRMGMRLDCADTRRMSMLMMAVMHMGVIVFDEVVRMPMRMLRTENRDDTRRHQETRHQVGRAQVLVQNQHGRFRAGEGGGRK